MQTRSHAQTITHARHIAVKVAADLKRLQRIYQRNSPSDSEIDACQQEITVLLNHGYLGTVTYGFKRNGKWIVALKYRSTGGGAANINHDPDGIGYYEANLSETGFTSFLSYSQSWDSLPSARQEEFGKQLPFSRVPGNEPGIENGRWGGHRNYLAGDFGITRSMIEWG